MCKSRRPILPAIAMLTFFCVGTSAQTYPERPVRIVVGFAPGGTVDVPTRIVATRLASVLGANVVVENKPGAGGNIAATLVAKSAPDGYTLHACGISSHGINSAIFAKMPYDPVRDFAPISMIGTVPNVLIVHPSMPVSSMGEFIAYAKANPGKVSVASAGIGTSQHLSLELLNSTAAIKIVHVPYKGGAPAMSDLLGGQVPAMVSGLPSALQAIKAGKVRAIAVTTQKRSLQLPDVPTISEAGVAGYEVTSWLGLCAPSGVPAAVLARLNKDLHTVLSMPEIQHGLAEQGYETAPTTAAELSAFIRAELLKWARVVKEAGITPE